MEAPAGGQASHPKAGPGKGLGRAVGSGKAGAALFIFETFLE